MSRKESRIFETGAVSRDVDFDKAIEEKTLLTGRIMLYRPAEGDVIEPYVQMMIDDKTIIILKSELGILPHGLTPVKMPGRLMDIIVLSKAANKEKTYYASRKEALEVGSKREMEDLRAGKYITGVVSRIETYGAFITFGAGKRGLLKHSDFSDDMTTIGDVYKPGDIIKVGLLNELGNGNILLKPEKVFEGPETTQFEMVRPQDIYFGVVKIIKEDRMFVSIGKNLVVMTAPPDNGVKITEGTKVQVLITSIRPDIKRIKGIVKKIFEG